MTLPPVTLAPALQVRAGQIVAGGDRYTAVGLDLVNLRVGVIDNLEIDAYVAPFEIRPQEDYGTATVRGTYRFLDEVVELGSALRLGHELFPIGVRRFLLEPQILRMLAHAGSMVRVDSGFFLPMRFGGPTTVIGMRVPLDVAIQPLDVFYVGLGTGMEVQDFSNAGPTTIIPASAFVGATVPLDDRPLLDIGGRFSMPLLILPGNDGNRIEERVMLGMLTFRLYFYL
jgi:hypothetical protein